MGEISGAGKRRDEPERYGIRIKGHLDDRWADWFEGMSITQENDGTTLLTGMVVDQAALLGLLRRVRDLGLSLISVIPLDRADAPEDNA
ncbi:MAG: hypothetical protein UZ15_CFX003001932 [Chloroflexi bacterium OLB15]|nr:MAG: hypothetical protein UZ15_CFX003001932 [Chloroflexi bacterium OLB15]